MTEALEKLKNITKNKEESIKLLESALDNDKFIEYLLGYFSKNDLLSEIDFSGFRERLSENEFQIPHREYHYPLIWNVLEEQSFTPIDCKNPLKWLSITFQMIQNDVIKPYYLAFLQNKKDGRNNIIEALRLANQGGTKELFDITRAILRRMFGNIKERRGKGVYEDIPFAIAWWQMYFAKEAQKHTDLSSDIIIQYFTENKSAYNNFIIEGKKLTIILDKNIRDGLFLYLSNNINLAPKNFKNITSKIGIESSWRSMASLTPQENKEIIESLII